MDEARKGELERVALEVRKDVVRMSGVARLHGLPSALALTDLLVYLYWERMKIFPDERNRFDRDRLVLSDPAASPALYACLARRGFFEREELWSYSRLGATLQGYPDIRTPGVDAPGGTSGLGIALGLSAALRCDGINSLVYCIMDTLALFHGAVWESLSEASSSCDGGIVLVIGAAAPNEDSVSLGILDAAAIERRLGAFGWHTTAADGHDFNSMEYAFAEATLRDGPAAVIVRTQFDLNALPGIGGSERPISADDVENALSHLDMGINIGGDAE
ncbi:MAG: transketolase [Synergistaceae bacterium]|jgi:transketolase|nr:transketolase [Synergistaceae bacterium]